MQGRVLMVQGTMSSVGKSLTVAALCRMFAQDGIRVAPFKAQNMALNSFVTRDGLEVGRAQAMQADAAGIDVTVEMNPVLIKPEADAFAQYVVMGKPWARISAQDYMVSRRQELWGTVTAALDSLRAQYELVVIEGAGSPAELNPRSGDIVNMAIAEYADAPVLLVGDIDRGGIFAQLIGTHALLPESERARIKGFIVNKFRGDASLFEDGVKILEQRSDVPVLGVVPYIPDLRIADEDSVALETRVDAPMSHTLNIAVIAFPHMSNFDDFDPLRAEPDVRVAFVRRAEELQSPDLIILPGTKTTIGDLQWMREHNLDQPILQLVRAGTPLIGICGGYQMLGETLRDPQHVESNESRVRGLNLVPFETTFVTEKQTVRVRGVVTANQGLFSNARGLEIGGYEIHMGRTTSNTDIAPLINLTHCRDEPTTAPDGVITTDGCIAGTYLHGLFDNDALRTVLLENLTTRKGATRPKFDTRFNRHTEYDRLTATFRTHLDMNAIYRIAGLV